MPSGTSLTVVSVVDKLDRRRDLLKTRSKFSKSRVDYKVSEGSSLSLEVPEFPYNTVDVAATYVAIVDGSSNTKNRLIPSAVSIELRLVTDRESDRPRQKERERHLTI